MQLAGLLMLAAILVTMGLDPDLYVSWVYGVPWLILISAAYFLWRARRHAPIEPVPPALQRALRHRPERGGVEGEERV